MNPFVIPTLETERLWLRPFRPSDFEDYAALRTDREVHRHLDCGPEPWDRGRSWRHLAFLIGHWYLGGIGTWALEEKATGDFLGYAGFAEAEGWPGCELNWGLVRRSWGNGFATEAGRAALDYAFTVLGRDEVISLILPENHASRRVAERLGLTPQGRHPMQRGDHWVYGIRRAP